LRWKRESEGKGGQTFRVKNGDRNPGREEYGDLRQNLKRKNPWIPACAGMTTRRKPSLPPSRVQCLLEKLGEGNRVAIEISPYDQKFVGRQTQGTV
jgi:hypothetical protein